MHISIYISSTLVFIPCKIKIFNNNLTLKYIYSIKMSNSDFEDAGLSFTKKSVSSLLLQEAFVLLKGNGFTHVSGGILAVVFPDGPKASDWPMFSEQHAPSLLTKWVCGS